MDLFDSHNPAFPTTHTSILGFAGRPDCAEFRAAWEAFFLAYWPPLYAFLRRSGSPREEALDLLQDFFLGGLDGSLLSSFDPAKGKLRTYLRACLRNHRGKAVRRQRVRVDGRPMPVLAIEEVEAELADSAADEPDQAFDREWALQVLTMATTALEADLASRGDKTGAGVLTQWVLTVERPPAADLAASLGITTGDLYTRATRLRQALSALVTQQVQAYSPGAVEAGLEADEVLRCLTGDRGR